jgi:hypothetical protein
MVDENNEDTPQDDSPEEAKPAPKAPKKTVSKRSTTEPVEKPKPTTDSEGNSGPGTGDMNWDKAKEAVSDVDWDSRIYQLKRLFLMFLASLAAAVARTVIILFATVNFIYAFITLDRLTPLSDLCGRLSAYISQCYDFIGYHSDEPVFPFADFPEAAERKKAE